MNPTLPQYPMKIANLTANAPRHACSFFLGFFNRIVLTGFWTRSIAGSVTASPTHTLAGATALTTEINVVTTATSVGDAVRLPDLKPGQAVELFNTAANAIAVFPGVAGTTIDQGSAGAAVTLSAGKRCRFACAEPGKVRSAQLGAPSA